MWRIALGLLDTLTAWQLKTPVVVADAGYGVSTPFRLGFEELGLSYVLALTGKEVAHPENVEPHRPAYGGLGPPTLPRYRTDTAVAGRPVVIELQVRRFRCRDRACKQATFAEQADGLTFRHGRRSAGLQTVLHRVAVMLAGRRPPGGRTRGSGEPVDTAAVDTPPAGARSTYAAGAGGG